MLLMSSDDVTRFAKRDWPAIDAAKDQDWLRRKQAMSPAQVLQRSDDLRRHAHALRPDWPSRADRIADVETHARVGQALRAVAHTSR